MPRTLLRFYCERDGASPVKKWLNDVKWRDRRGFAKCMDRLRLLEALGRDLRRPHADYLRDGILELRARAGTVNYRILYFFYGRDAVVLAHGFTKESGIPDSEIDRALHRKRAVEAHPEWHLVEEDDE